MHIPYSKIVCLSFFCLSLVMPTGLVARATTYELIRATNAPAVYYVDAQGVRHPFPNVATYQSWYGTSFSRVVRLSPDVVKKYPLGKNVTMHPGKALVQFQSSETIYAVETGGVLRELASAAIAENIYGEQWRERVVVLPDTTFGDYTVGKSISRDDDLPSGSLLRRPGTDAYVWLRNGIAQPFASSDAVVANGFALSDAITTDLRFFNRTRSIDGRTAMIFDPTAAPLVDTADCENRNLRAAFIVVGPGKIPADQVAAVERIKAQVSQTYADASQQFSSIDVSYPTILLSDDGQLLQRNDAGGLDVRTELINTFYETHPDQFDFIFVWTTFPTPPEANGEIAHFVPVTNPYSGINRSFFNAGEVYGSGGKLKGIISMGEIAKYHPDTTVGMNQALTYVMHELLHQWSAYVQFAGPDGKNHNDLLRAPEFQHWSYYLSVLSPVGGSGWRDNGNGTFTSALSELPDGALRRFSQLDLYLMGLLPASWVQPIFYVEPTTPNAIGNTIAGTARYVTIDQIIAANGALHCTPQLL